MTLQRNRLAEGPERPETQSATFLAVSRCTFIRERHLNGCGSLPPRRHSEKDALSNRQHSRCCQSAAGRIRISQVHSRPATLHQDQHHVKGHTENPLKARLPNYSFVRVIGTIRCPLSIHAKQPRGAAENRRCANCTLHKRTP